MLASDSIMKSTPCIFCKVIFKESLNLNYLEIFYIKGSDHQFPKTYMNTLIKTRK